MANTLRTFDSPQLAAEACGQAIFKCIAESREQRGIANVAISGGSTPRIMFEWMTGQGFDWSGVHLFWVDERCVPPDDEQSNYRMTKLSLLDKVDLAPSQVHRVFGEDDPSAAAGRYADEIRHHFSLQEEELPVFDVIQRGMGPDAHTASLFPLEPMILDQAGLCAALWVEKMKQHRVTLLPGVLEKAALTLNLVTGQDKAGALVNVLDGDSGVLEYPARISSAEMVWFLDRQAHPGS